MKAPIKLTKQRRQAAKHKPKQLNLHCLNRTTEKVNFDYALYSRVLLLEVSDVPLPVLIVVRLLTGDKNCEDDITDILIRLLTTDDGDITDEMKECDNNFDDEVADISRVENDDTYDVTSSDDDSDTNDGLLFI